MAAKARTAKQKEFDLLLKYSDNKTEFTKRIQTKDVDLIRKYKDKLDWWAISTRKTLTNEFIDEFYEYLKPYTGTVTVSPLTPTEFLKNNRKYINWYNFVYDSSGARFSVDFLKTFEPELKKYHNIIVKMKNLPQETKDYLLNNDNKDMIENLSTKSTITLKELEKYKDSLNWMEVSKYAKCLCNPKSFEKFKDYINIYEYTSMTSYYRFNEKGLLDKFSIIYNEDFLLENKDKINWSNIINFDYWYIKKKIESKEIPFPSDFFVKHKDKLPKNAIYEYNQFKIKLGTISSKYYYLLPWE